METYLHKERIVAEPEALVQNLQSIFADDLSDIDIRGFSEGSSEKPSRKHIWMTIKKDRFLDLIDEIGKYDFPNFHVTSGDDEGDSIILHYHFDLYRAVGRGSAFTFSICVRVQKDDLTMPSLFSRIPGVEYSEREIQEMFGIDHIGLPNKGLVFLPEDWDRDVLPWRRDETAPGGDLVQELS